MSNVWASPVAQTAKNLPAMQETEVWSLGQKGPLEKGMEIHSSIPVWRIPWTEEPSGYSPCSQKELDTAERLTLWLFLSINVQGDTWDYVNVLSSNLSPSSVNIHWWSFLVNYYISCYEMMIF